MDRLTRATLLVSTLGLAVFVQAQVIDIAVYTGGEFDGSPIDGDPVVSAIDSSGNGNHLSLTSSPAGWSTNVAPPTTRLGTSTYSYQFGGNTAFVSSGVVMGSPTEYGLEVWVNLLVIGGDMTVLLNGTGADGMGIGVYQGNWAGLLGGVAWLDGNLNGSGSVAATIETWTHLAIVNTGGTTTFYVNGAVIDYENATSPFYGSPPSLLLGADNASGGSMQGFIDNARVFAIAGTFNAATDLNLAAIPEPSTYAALAGLGALGVAAIRRRRAA